MTTRYIALSTGTSNVMTAFMTIMQLFIEINFLLSAVCDCGISWSYSLTIFEGNKIAFKMSYDKQNLTLVIISY